MFLSLWVPTSLLHFILCQGTKRFTHLDRPTFLSDLSSWWSDSISSLSAMIQARLCSLAMLFIENNVDKAINIDNRVDFIHRFASREAIKLINKNNAVLF